MTSVADILVAIRSLARPDRLRLVEELAADLESEPTTSHPPEPPPGSNLVIRHGFYVYTGPVLDASVLDHRLARDERTEHLARGAGAGRD
jgi:hypothetical protein